MQGMKNLRLSDINKGALEELFQRELSAVMENIDDPSTVPTEARKITIEIDIKANEEREMGNIVTRVKSKLAPARAQSSYFIIQEGTPWEPNTHQGGLGFEDSGNVTSIIDGKAKASGERDE